MRQTRVIIDSWCDFCALESPEGETNKVDSIESWTLAIGSGDNAKPVPKVVDVCELHAKAFLELADLMSHIHQLPGPKQAPTRDPVVVAAAHRPPSYFVTKPCPVCRSVLAANTLVSHVWRVHRPDERPPALTTCPTCRKVYDGAAGMATHRRMAHNYDALADVLSGVPGYKHTAPQGQRNNSTKAIKNSQPELPVGS